MKKSSSLEDIIKRAATITANSIDEVAYELAIYGTISDDHIKEIRDKHTKAYDDKELNEKE